MMSNACKIETIPPEILLHIFSLAASGYDPQCEPSTGWIGMPSYWTTDLRVKLSLVRVCKTWRRLTLNTLYHRIYMDQLQQLSALVGVLEEQAGYREWVHHVHGLFVLSSEWEGTYVKTVARLMILCSSCRTFSWQPLEDERENMIRSRFSTISIFCNMSTVQSAFVTLRTLSIVLDYNPARDALFQGLSVVHFPNLEELACKATYGGTADSLDAIAKFFILPNLRLLTITPSISILLNELRTDEEAESICNVLERHGDKLSSFTLDLTRIRSPIQKSLEGLLKLTPNLISIKLLTFALSSNNLVFASPCVSLRRLELYVYILVHSSSATWAEQYPSDDPRQMEGFLTMAANRSNFPNLQSVVLHDALSPRVPLGEDVEDGYADSSFQYVLSWVRRFRELGIALLRKDDKPVISPEQERWGAWSRPKDSEASETAAA